MGWDCIVKQRAVVFMNDNSVSEDEGLLLAMVPKPMEIFSKGKFLGQCPKIGYLHFIML